MKHSRRGPRSGWRHTVAMSGGMASVWWMGPWCCSSAGQVSSETPGLTGRATIQSMYRCVFFFFCLSDILISTPDLHIINYGVGLPGSQHDAMEWKETCIPKEHDRLLDVGE